MSRHRPESQPSGIPAHILIDRVRHPNRPTDTKPIRLPVQR